MKNKTTNIDATIETESVVVPNKVANQMHLGHLGKIFSNLSIVCLLISLAGVLSFVLYAIIEVLGVFAVILMFLIIILTLGAILAIIPGYWGTMKTLISWFGSLGTIMEKVGAIITKIWPIVIPLAIAFAVTSLICLIFDKTQKHTARIVFSSIVIVIAIIVLIVFLVGGAVWMN